MYCTSCDLIRGQQANLTKVIALCFAKPDLAVVKVFDLNGRMGSSERIPQHPGWNYTTLATPTAANGLMVVQLATSTRQGAKKFYMQR